MYSKQFSRIILMGLVLALLAGIVLPAAAQDETVTTVVITESDVNSQPRGALEPPTEEVSFVFQTGEIVITGLIEREGEGYNVEAVIVPSLVEERLVWTVASLTTTDANGIVSPRDPATGQATGLLAVWQRVFLGAVDLFLRIEGLTDISRLRHLPVYSITIAEGVITLDVGTLPNEQTDARGVNTLEEAGASQQIVINEQQANDALAAVVRRNERIESYTVDFTPEGVVVEVTAIGANNEPLGIIAILIGLLVDTDDGTVVYQINEVVVTNVTGTNTDRLEQFAVDAWSRFVRLQVGDASVVSFETTASELILIIEQA